jgi:hypothetical protein
MFPIQISFTIANQAELTAIQSAVSQILGGAPTKEAAAQVEKPKKDTPAKTAPSAPTAAPAAAPAASTAAPAPQPSTGKAADAVSAPARADVSAAAVKLALKDKPKAIEILAGFGAKGVKDVPDDKLAEVFPLIQAALEA